VDKISFKKKNKTSKTERHTDQAKLGADDIKLGCTPGNMTHVWQMNVRTFVPRNISFMGVK